MWEKFIYHKFWTSSTLPSVALHLLCKFSLPETITGAGTKWKRQENFYKSRFLAWEKLPLSPLHSFPSAEKLKSPGNFLYPVLKTNLSNSRRIWLHFSHPWQEEFEWEQLKKWVFLALSGIRFGNEHKRENKPHIYCTTSLQQLDVI